jgi:ATP-dependent DNA helicase RecG
MKYAEKDSFRLEFKKNLPQNNQIVKTIIGFCNQNGGKLIVGVDNNGTIIGVPEAELNQVLEYLDKTIFESTQPPIIPRVSIQAIGDKNILIIEVSPGMNKPYYLKAEGLAKGTYIRLGRNTLRATEDVIQELRWESRSQKYDEMAVQHATIDDLDFKKIERFLKSRKIVQKEAATGATTEALLKSYNLVTSEHGYEYPTTAGILLFGNNPQKFLSEAFIICSRFAGIEGRDTLWTQDCTGTLFDQYFCAMNFIKSQLYRSFTIKETDIIRKDILEIPEEAFREAIVNALMHRNYHIQAPIKIAIYDNRVEIFSPGIFPGPLAVDSLKLGMSYMRNRAISKILREAELSEKLGSGFIKIFNSYAQRGLKEPSVIEGDNFIKVILPRPSPTRINHKIADEDLNQILNLFETSIEYSIGDIMERLRLARSTTARKLNHLVDQGILKKMGKGRATRYLRS